MDLDNIYKEGATRFHKKTPCGRTVYGWGVGKLKGDMIDELSYHKKGGCFLITHCRDEGYIFWYQKDKLVFNNPKQAWLIDGQEIVKTYPA